jgi:hypothetical protein
MLAGQLAMKTSWRHSFSTHLAFQPDGLMIADARSIRRSILHDSTIVIITGLIQDLGRTTVVKKVFEEKSEVCTFSAEPLGNPQPRFCIRYPVYLQSCSQLNDLSQNWLPIENTDLLKKQLQSTNTDLSNK